MKCSVVETKDVIARSGDVGGTMIICEVERFNVHPAIMRKTPNGSPYVDLESLQPISRLGANDYGRTTGTFAIPRPPPTLRRTK